MMFFLISEKLLIAFHYLRRKNYKMFVIKPRKKV